VWSTFWPRGVPRILQWRGFTWWGAEPEGLGDRSLPVVSRGKALVGGLSPPEAEAKSEISVQFLPFFCKKNYDLMSIGAELGQYNLQTYNSKKLWRSNLGGLNALTPSGYASVLTSYKVAICVRYGKLCQRFDPLASARLSNRGRPQKNFTFSAEK